MLAFGAIAGSKTVQHLSLTIITVIFQKAKKKKKKKKKNLASPLFYTAKVIQNFYISKGNVNNKIKLKQKGINY